MLNSEQQMELIIDGYNMMGIDHGLRGPLEHRRNWLIQQLLKYRKTKGFGVTVVFDGWRSGRINEVEENRDGMTVLYSRQGEKADDVIVRIAHKKGSGCVVVTSDREIRNAVEKFGAVPIYSGEFAEILRELDRPFHEEDYNESDAASFGKGNPNRLSKSEKRRQERLRKLRP